MTPIRHSALTLALLPLLALLLALAPTAAADTLYVDANLNSGVDDGSSWADAFKGASGLQTALAAALAGDEIWVADGTYLASNTGNRGDSFSLKNGVTLYGGFAGGESDPSERPPFGSAESILDGDLGNNDGGGIFTDNTWNIIKTAGTNASAVIDGFVVQGGAATTGGGNRDRGAGILVISAVSPTVRNCVFRKNRSSFGGAAGYINNGGAPSFTDCTFEDGLGGSFGGAFDIAGGGSVLFERCLFRGNSAARAGALEIFATNGVVVVNCIFVDNTATGASGGGAIWVGSGGNTQFRSCTIVNNSATLQAVGGLRNQGAGGTTCQNTILWGNSGAGGAMGSANQVDGTNVNYCNVQGGLGAGVGNIAVAPVFANAAGGDFRLEPTSGGIDAGNNSATPAGVDTDYGGCPRKIDDPATADSGLGVAPFIDMGAHEYAPDAFEDLGFALAGTHGDPVLTAGGTLCVGDPVTLALSNALENSTTYLVIGVTSVNLPFYGGTLVPAFEAPFGLFIALPTGPLGNLPLSDTWPGGVPGGTELYFQHWIVDAGGPFGFAASNAVRGTVP